MKTQIFDENRSGRLGRVNIKNFIFYLDFAVLLRYLIFLFGSMQER